MCIQALVITKVTGPGRPHEAFILKSDPALR